MNAPSAMLRYTPRMSLAPGTLLGSYEVLAPLGSGGMGEVWRARDTRLGREVAIKSLPAAFAASSTSLARFRHEAQALASLNHPNVAAIFGLEEAEGAPFLVLELVLGETLAARLARGALPLRDALAIGVQIAAAIESAHERGIVHRDLKPGNVMITTAGAAKVLDFGLAKSDTGVAPFDRPEDTRRETSGDAAATEAGVILGTAAYMSPEQARGKPVDRRTDVWSFGCVLFETLTARAAFSGETRTDLLARILERDPDWTLLPAATPSRVRDVLRRCLQKDMDSRPRDIRDVRLALCEEQAAGGKPATSPEKSIAVLPFENLSGPEDEYFADGVTDEILNALAHVDGLRVAARTSCFAFKGRREDLRGIGEKLDVTTLLEGTVRRAGARLRITAQLVNAADGYQLWSERYDGEMTDVFAVQDEIAGAITRRLRGTLHADDELRRASHGTKNLEAFELLLKGRALQNKRGRHLPEAIACFERAIELDPQYAEAMAWLSDSYRLMATFGSAPACDVMPKAKQLAEQALAIDESLAEAWATLACIAEQYEWEFERAGKLWDRALSIDPRHARGRSQHALWAFIRGTMTASEAVAETQRALQDDPLNSWVGAMHSYLLGFAERHEESIEEAVRALDLDRESFFAYWNLVRGYAWAGRYERAIAMSPALLRMSGRHHWALGMLGWSYGKAGRIDLARAIYDELEARARTEHLSHFWLAVAAGACGLSEPMIRHTQCAVDQHDSLAHWMPVVPFFDVARTHPRFAEILRPLTG